MNEKAKWYVGVMNDAYFVIDKLPQPGPIDYACSADHRATVIVACGTDQRLAERLAREHNAGSLLECPMCSAPQSFSIDIDDLALGYCIAEQKAWRIKLGEAVCHLCLKVVPTRYCGLCDLRYCNEGDDDNRFCAIQHDNSHEDMLANHKTSLKEERQYQESVGRFGAWNPYKSNC